MTARQEKVREALELLPPVRPPGMLEEMDNAILAAALAEVEEWEANRRLMAGRITGCRARAEAAEAERDQWEEAAKSQAKESVWWQRAEAAEAEADRLDALLQTVGSQLKFATAVIAEAEKLHPGITRQAGLAAGGTDITS